MVFSQLIPESLATGSRRLSIVALLGSAGAMIAIEFAIGF